MIFIIFCCIICLMLVKGLNGQNNSKKLTFENGSQPVPFGSARSTFYESQLFIKVFLPHKRTGEKSLDLKLVLTKHFFSFFIISFSHYNLLLKYFRYWLWYDLKQKQQKPDWGIFIFLFYVQPSICVHFTFLLHALTTHLHNFIQIPPIKSRPLYLNTPHPLPVENPLLAQLIVIQMMNLSLNSAKDPSVRGCFSKDVYVILLNPKNKNGRYLNFICKESRSLKMNPCKELDWSN